MSYYVDVLFVFASVLPSVLPICIPRDTAPLDHIPAAGPKAVVSFWKVLVGHMAPLTFSTLFSLCVLQLGCFFSPTFL